MPGLLINGKEVEVPGLKILNCNDDPKLKRSKEDGRTRNNKGQVSKVIIHTTAGIPGGKTQIPQFVIPGGKDMGREFKTAAYWASDSNQSSAHIIIDADGSIGCIDDLATVACFHASQSVVNQDSIGIEIYQQQDGGIWQASLEACVKLCDALASLFGIQRQIHLPYKKGPIKRLSTGGKDCVGFFGHRDITNNRGLGDPGDIIMDMLVKAGYEKFDFVKEEDLTVWKARQQLLKTPVIDGIPGPRTVSALKSAGYVDGIWTLGKPAPVVVAPPEPPKTEAPPADPKPEPAPEPVIPDKPLVDVPECSKCCEVCCPKDGESWLVKLLRKLVA